MAARKPRIVYAWVTRKLSARGARRLGEPRVKVECFWSLVGANGEHMCSSFPEGYRDKADARRAVMDAIHAFTGDYQFKVYAREVGPGPRPKADLAV
jgi:hypothetical protein